MADDIQIYCNCMERVRRQVHIADQVFAGKTDTHDRDLNAELISCTSESSGRNRVCIPVRQSRKVFGSARRIRNRVECSPHAWLCGED